MSRIVKSGNPDVREFKLVSSANQGKTLNFEGRSFSSGRTEGSMDESEVAALVDQAKAAARVEGQRETEKKMLGTLNQGLQKLEGVLDEVSRFRRELFKEAEEEILDFVRLFTKKVLAKEVSLAPELLKTMVERSLDLIEKEKRINIVFNPTDFSLFQSAKDDFLKQLPNATEMRIIQDPKIPAGSAFIKTETLQIEVSVDSMVDEMLNQIQQAKITGQDVNKEGDEP